jgi:hypothetical protein
VLGEDELVAARRAAEEAMNATSDSEAVFAAVGCAMKEAEAFAHVRSAQMLSVLRDLEAEGALELGEPIVGTAEDQALQVWLNGCLVGLYLAGPADDSMDSEALMAAERTLMFQTPEPGEDSVDATLRKLDLESKPMLDRAERVGSTFAQPLADLGVPSTALPSCATTLARLWLNGLSVATQARREASAAVPAH